MLELSEWNSFYVIVGSAAGALIGLQFVAMTLIAQRRLSETPEAGSAFATPTIVHFGVVLLLSAIVSAPWRQVGPVSVILGLFGLIGLLYTINITRRVRAQTFYKPVFEDWLFHALLPFASYTILASAAFVTYSHVRLAMFIVAAATLLFLFIGVHNSWDAVTYHIFSLKKEPSNTSESVTKTNTQPSTRVKHKR